MKKILIGLVVGVVALGGLLAFAFFNLNALLERSRDRIAVMAGDALGREVSLERASAAFSNGLAVRIEGLRIAEDPRFGEGDFLALDTAFVELALWPLLAQRVEIRAIRLERPAIALIASKRGWNFASLGESQAKADPRPEQEPGPPLALLIGALEIEDGTVVYTDRTKKDGLALTIEDFDSSGVDLTLDGPLALDFSGRVRPTRGDAALASEIEGRLAISDRATGEGELELASPSFAPLLLGIDLSEGEERERIDGLDLAIGLPADAAKTGYPIALTARSARLAGFDFDAIDGSLVYRGSKLRIDRFATGFAGGRAELAGRMAFGQPGQAPFDLDLKLDGLDSNQLAHRFLGLPLGAVSGRIGGELDLAGRSLDWETLTRTLGGRVRLAVDGGALEQVNVLSALTTRLVGDPGVGRFLASSLRDAAPESMRGDRTPFDSLRLLVELEQGRMRADDFEIAAKDFALAASGGLGLDGLLDGEGRIRFSPELSRRILKKADRFAPLLADGEIAVLPLVMGGKLSAPFLRPDLSALGGKARVAATEELKEKAAKKLTDAIFGKKKNRKREAEGSDAADPAAEGTAAGAASSEAPTEQDLQRDAAKDLVERGLGRLLGE